MKRLVPLLLLLAFWRVPTSLEAQELGPPGMGIAVQWIGIGVVIGSGIGVAGWLLDPGDPNQTLSDLALDGASWGAVGGIGLAIFILRNTARQRGVPLVQQPPPPEALARALPEPFLETIPKPFASPTLSPAPRPTPRPTLPLFSLHWRW